MALGWWKVQTRGLKVDLVHWILNDRITKMSETEVVGYVDLQCKDYK